MYHRREKSGFWKTTSGHSKLRPTAFYRSDGFTRNESPFRCDRIAATEYIAATSKSAESRRKKIKFKQCGIKRRTFSFWKIAACVTRCNRQLVRRYRTMRIFVEIFFACTLAGVYARHQEFTAADETVFSDENNTTSSNNNYNSFG